MNNQNDNYEICIICKKKLDVLRSTPIDSREYYILGAGQMCSECYHNFAKHLSNYK